MMKRKFIKYSLITFMVLAFYSEKSLEAQYTDDAIAFISKQPSEEISKSLYIRYINKSSDISKQGFNNEAKSLLWKAINLFPNNPDAYVNLGVIHIKEKNFEAASRNLLKALDLSKSSYSKKEIIFYNLGLCFYFKGDQPKAIQYLKDAILIYPKFDQAMFYLGMSYDEMRDYANAYLNVFKARLFIKDSDYDYKSKAKSYLDSKRSFNIGNMVLSKNLLEEAKTFIEEKEFDKAILLLSESIFLNFKFHEAYYHLGRAYSFKGNFQKSISALEKSIAINPEFIEAYIELGNVFQAINNSDRTLAILEKALIIDKNNPKIFYKLAIMYLNKGNSKVAEQYFDQAQEKALLVKNLDIIEKINLARKQNR
ncbi:MAG: tetratricopeptide repeat protein [Candidatus Omnitrophica bacterium]|nr:tetratricopeptide repeat protein [Candidatus Omnitrophota bacterium]